MSRLLPALSGEQIARTARAIAAALRDFTAVGVEDAVNESPTRIIGRLNHQQLYQTLRPVRQFVG